MTPPRNPDSAPTTDPMAHRAALHPVTVEVLLLRLGGQPAGRLAYRVAHGPLPDGATPDTTATTLAHTGTEAENGTRGAEVEVLHSTSWRHDPTHGVVLTYAALPDPRPDLPAVALHAPSVVCSGDPLQPAPDALHGHHVAAHAVRHLAYLLDHDPGIAATARRPHLTSLWQAMREAAAAMPTAPHTQAHRRAEHGTPPDEVAEAS